MPPFTVPSIRLRNCSGARDRNTSEALSLSRKRAVALVHGETVLTSQRRYQLSADDVLGIIGLRPSVSISLSLSRGRLHALNSSRTPCIERRRDSVALSLDLRPRRLGIYGKMPADICSVYRR